MIRLSDLELFVSTAESGSLSSAARRLDISPARASASIKRLEETLGGQLFVRSTRSLRLTVEGEAFLAYCRIALQALSDGREAVAPGYTFQGILQLSIPSDLGRNVILPLIDDFKSRHPLPQIRLLCSDRVSDIYRHPVDFAIRYGKQPDSGLIALPIAPDNRRVLCAAPSYIRRYGIPVHPSDLEQHNCLTYMLSDCVYNRWNFYRDGMTAMVQVRGDLSADDGDVVRRWAVAGHGIAYKSALDVVADLREGRLIRLCADWEGEPVPLNLICTDRRQLSPAVQLLRTFLAERLAEHVLPTLAAANQG
jgi:DNA-binding transcriptional LysR family regulator